MPKPVAQAFCFGQVERGNELFLKKEAFRGQRQKILGRCGWWQ
jgi:hypothetical protein